MKTELIIIGGMGPQASLKLHELVLSKSREHHDGAPDSYPSILHASVPVPDFIASRDKYVSALKLLADTCNGLPLKEATAIGMACNTAHLMLDELPLSNTPFVSMVRAVVDRAKSMNAQRIGLLASPTTLKAGLYESALRAVGIEVAEPNDDDVQKLNDVIHKIIDGFDPSSLRPVLNSISQRLVSDGADTILLGCTELPIVGIDPRFKQLDSLSCLAEAMLSQHFGREKVK